jgi:DNA replication protein DnaC
MPICQKHQNEMRGESFNLPGGTKHTFHFCDICSEEQEAEKELERKQREKRIIEFKREKRNDGIPMRFWDSKIEQFTNIKPIIDWLNNPKESLYITGPCGTGKTHLATAIAYYLRDLEKECAFVIASNLFLQLRNSFNSDDKNEMDIINKYSSPSFAIFDDIGAQKISDYVIEAWYNIIDTRYGKVLPTVFTSNMTLSEISTFMSDRIASRIASGLIFELHGNDRRLIRQ